MPSPFGLPFVSPSGIPIKAQAGQAVCVCSRGPSLVNVHWGSASDVQGAIPTARMDDDDSQDVGNHPSDESTENVVTDEEDPE